MSVEQGLVILVQAGLSGVPGGFAVQLPKDTISATTPQAWTWRTIASVPNYTLSGQVSLTKWNVDISSHGLTMADAMFLASSIDAVLRGSYSGTLGDSNSTVVQNIIRTPTVVDGYSDINRSFVRTVEYEVFYNQN